MNVILHSIQKYKQDEFVKHCGSHLGLQDQGQGHGIMNWWLIVSANNCARMMQLCQTVLICT